MNNHKFERCLLLIDKYVDVGVMRGMWEACGKQLEQAGASTALLSYAQA